jgi:RimJ/RimL family protein N-acetyltransferase
VRTSNAPAIALYRKLGFEEVGLRRGYYLDTGEDAYLMTLFHIDDEMVWQKLAAEIAAIERQSRPPSDGDSPAGR